MSDHRPMGEWPSVLCRDAQDQSFRCSRASMAGLDPVADMQLLQDRGHVVLHRLFLDVELPTHYFCCSCPAPPASGSFPRAATDRPAGSAPTARGWPASPPEAAGKARRDMGAARRPVLAQARRVQPPPTPFRMNPSAPPRRALIRSPSSSDAVSIATCGGLSRAMIPARAPARPLRHRQVKEHQIGDRSRTRVIASSPSFACPTTSRSGASPKVRASPSRIDRMIVQPARS